MSFKVLVIPEDPTNNGYILRPLIEAIPADAGKPAAKVDILTNPKLSGYDHALKAIRAELPDRYGHWDLWIFIPDGNLASAEAMAKLEEELRAKGITLLCCPAQPEVEIYACAAYRTHIEGGWNFKLWEHITRDLKAGEKLNGGKPKPEVVYRKAEDALLTLAGEWKERFDQLNAATPGQDRTPPVMIIVCDNTDIAEHFHRAISGEEIIEADIPDEEDEDDAPKRKNKAKAQKRYGNGLAGFDEFWNRKGAEVTLRIDSELLSAAESEDPKATRREAAEELRRIVSTVGRVGEAGERIRCVVSVNMLSEGWDANNVTHILGLRAFHSQLLCEQVVGRGLRRLDYTPDLTTGLLTAEYVDIFGVPFSLIPFKGREPGGGPPPEDRPKHEVLALPERKAFEIRFPIVEGYVVSLKRDLVRCDVRNVERTGLDPWSTPTDAFVRPQVGYQIGHPGAHGGFGFELVNRQAYYDSVHPQTIEFEISREVVRALTEAARSGKESLRGESRSALFPQVLRIVQRYVRERVEFNGLHPCEVGLQTYAQRIIGLLVAAITPDDAHGEALLLPRLNRYKPIGSTESVHFKTVKPVQVTGASHLNFVACDTDSWEQAAMFQLEKLAKAGVVFCYARNDHMEFNIPYELYGNPHVYEPDFIVRLHNGVNVVLEIKGKSQGDTDAKHQAARRWVSAVNQWGRLGEWDFVVCREPQKLTEILRQSALQTRGKGASSAGAASGSAGAVSGAQANP